MWPPHSGTKAFQSQNLLCSPTHPTAQQNSILTTVWTWQELPFLCVSAHAYPIVPTTLSVSICFLTQPLKGLFQFQLFNEANILFESLAEMTASSPAGPWHLRVYLPTSSWELGGHCSGFEVRWIRVGVLTQTFSSCVNVGKSLSPSFNNNPFPKNYWDNPVT